MKEYIKKLQSKPENERKAIVFWSLAVCMCLVCFIWVSGLGPKFNKEENASKREEAVKPFALFGQAVSDTYNNVTASVGNISIPKKEELKVEEVKEAKVEKQIDLIPVEQQ